MIEVHHFMLLICDLYLIDMYKIWRLHKRTTFFIFMRNRLNVHLYEYLHQKYKKNSEHLLFFAINKDFLTTK